MNSMPCGCVFATKNKPAEFCPEARRLWEDAEAVAGTMREGSTEYLDRLEMYLQHFRQNRPQPGMKDMFEELLDDER